MSRLPRAAVKADEGSIIHANLMDVKKIVEVHQDDAKLAA